MSETEATLPGAAAEGLADLSGLGRDDGHSLSGWIHDVNPFGIVTWVSRSSLRSDGGFDLGPLLHDGLLGRRFGRVADGAGLHEAKS